MPGINLESSMHIKINREMHGEFHPKHKGLIHPDVLVILSTYGPVNGYGDNIIPKKVTSDIHIIPLPWDRETGQEIHARLLVEDVIFEEIENLYCTDRALDVRVFIIWPNEYAREITCQERVED